MLFVLCSVVVRFMYWGAVGAFADAPQWVRVVDFLFTGAYTAEWLLPATMALMARKATPWAKVGSRRASASLRHCHCSAVDRTTSSTSLGPYTSKSTSRPEPCLQSW